MNAGDKEFEYMLDELFEEDDELEGLFTAAYNSSLSTRETALMKLAAGLRDTDEYTKQCYLDKVASANLSTKKKFSQLMKLFVDKHPDYNRSEGYSIPVDDGPTIIINGRRTRDISEDALSALYQILVSFSILQITSQSFFYYMAFASEKPVFSHSFIYLKN